MNNIDELEIAKFSSQAPVWWNHDGEMKALHRINPLRVQYIDEKAAVAGKTLLDIGCGGGILTEAMAKKGAQVTGIDMSPAALEVAKLHQHKEQLNIHYELISAEEKAVQNPQSYDIVTCLELLEHVPDPASIVKACAQLVKPDGHVFISTLNRNMKSYLQAIIAGEYILKWIPKNTHDYAKFIKPSELIHWCRNVQLSPIDIVGIQYQLLSREFQITKDVSVNYLLWLRKI